MTPAKDTLAWYQWYIVTIVEGQNGGVHRTLLALPGFRYSILLAGRVFFIALVIINGIMIGVQADHGGEGSDSQGFFDACEYILVSPTGHQAPDGKVNLAYSSLDRPPALPHR